MALNEVKIKREEKIRIGPISLFTLISVICLAVLAVLAFSTANASYTMSERQARSVTGMYQNEQAAQEFVACLDDALASGGTAAVEPALASACTSAREAAGGEAEVTASMANSIVYAQFTSNDGRVLDIEVTIRNDASYRIDKWKVTAVQNEEQPQGNLFIMN